jgi:ribA/ribD-fused uncharacterized protein
MIRLHNQTKPTVTKDSILGFFGEYRFLSNFHILETPIELFGLSFNTSEGAYMASKTDDFSVQMKIAATSKPAEAKKIGRQLKLRDNWDQIKDEVMYNVCKQKFEKNQDIRYKLLATGDKYLEETNYWNDQYWGVCNQIGYNALGNILMKIRVEFCIKDCEICGDGKTILKHEMVKTKETDRKVFFRECANCTSNFAGIEECKVTQASIELENINN